MEAPKAQKPPSSRSGTGGLADGYSRLSVCERFMVQKAAALEEEVGGKTVNHFIASLERKFRGITFCARRFTQKPK